MSGEEDSMRRPQLKSHQEPTAWTSLHSWIFLAIIAVGMIALVAQNRFHYLSPLGLGKAYRIDKVFGGIQEFDPAKGWIVAQLQYPIQPQAMSMMEPQMMPGSHAVPMNMPAPQTRESVAGNVSPQTAPKPDVISPTPVKESQDALQLSAQKVAKAQPPIIEAAKEEKISEFKRIFPDYGDDEFQLANDDLYPDWKKMQPNGSWPEFLQVYKQFVQWWQDAGSPPEPGYKLWKEFLASR